MSHGSRCLLVASLLLYAALDAVAARGNGKVAGYQKISATAGGFGGTLSSVALFGRAVAGIGDRDGDGIVDVAVGAPGYGEFEPGAVWVILLNADGSVKGEHAIGAGAGGFAGTLELGDQFGRAVAVLGDLDGNGATDLAVGAPGDDDGAEDTGAVWILLLDQAGNVIGEQKIGALTAGIGTLDEDVYFGYAVASLGDLDGDGVEDVVASAPWDGENFSRRGSIRVLFLNADGTLKASQKIDDTAGGLGATLNDYDLFGISTAGLGDLDGDGVRDVAVGAEHDRDGGDFTGAVYLLFMEADGGVKAHQKISALSGGLVPPIERGEHFSGGGLANLGDLNGDGVVDLAVGQYTYPDETTGEDEGVVWVLFLSTDGSVRAYQEINRTHGTFSANFGRPWPWGLGAIGDVNGDGIQDLATADADDGGHSAAGAVWIMFGDGAPATLCDTPPVMGCAAATKTQVTLRARLIDRADRLAWKWRSSGGTLADLGDPTAGTSYALCVWDNDGGTPIHAASLEVAAGSGWSTVGAGRFQYRDASGAQSGLTAIDVTTTATASHMTLTAKGVRLPMPVSVSANAFFTKDPMVTVQLVGSNGTCLGADYVAARRNTSSVFKAAGP